MSKPSTSTAKMNGTGAPEWTAEDEEVFRKWGPMRDRHSRRAKEHTEEATVAKTTTATLATNSVPSQRSKKSSALDTAEVPSVQPKSAAKPAKKSAAKKVASPKVAPAPPAQKPIVGKRVTSISALSHSQQASAAVAPPASNGKRTPARNSTASASRSSPATTPRAKATTASTTDSPKKAAAKRTAKAAAPIESPVASSPAAKPKASKKSTAKPTQSALSEANGKQSNKKRAHDETIASESSPIAPSNTALPASKVKKSAAASAIDGELLEPAAKKRKLSERRNSAKSASANSSNAMNLDNVTVEHVPLQIPAVLNQKGGIYEWRESDCEEARCYEYNRVWYSQPEHLEAWKNEGESLDIVKERTYGEVTMQGMLCLFSELNLGKNDVFVDIGSGLGNLVMFASFVKGASKSYGVEIQHNRHVAAQHIRDDLAMLHKPYFDEKSVEFVYTPHSELSKCPGIENILSTATVVFINNILFNSKTMHSCLQTLNNLGNINAVFVFTSDPWPRHKSRKDSEIALKFWKSIEVNDACSWCSKNLKFFFYTFAFSERTQPPHYIYNAPIMAADHWILDPNDSETSSSSSSSRGSKSAPAPRAASRFVSTYAAILVPHEARLASKQTRRNGWTSWEDDPMADHSLPKSLARTKNSKALQRTPTPIYNLKGEAISFLVPESNPGESSLEERLYIAFNAAKNAALRNGRT